MKKLFTKARYLLALVSLVLLGTNVAVAQETGDFGLIQSVNDKSLGELTFTGATHITNNGVERGDNTNWMTGQSRSFTLADGAYSATNCWQKKGGTTDYDDTYWLGYGLTIESGYKFTITGVRGYMAMASDGATFTWKVVISDASGNELYASKDKTTAKNAYTDFVLKYEDLSQDEKDKIAGLTGDIKVRIYYYNDGGNKYFTVPYLTVSGTVEEDVRPVYTVTTSVSPANTGTLTPESGSTFVEGSDVTFTATPAAGYKLSTLTVDGNVVNGSPYTLKGITKDVTATAEFEALPKITYVLGDGVGGMAPAVEYAEAGTQVTLPNAMLISNPGKTLTGWTDGNSTYKVGERATIDKDVTFTAVFEDNQASLGDAETTVNWILGKQSGAPVMAFERVVGYYTQKAEINGKTIDVAMTIDTTADSYEKKAGFNPSESTNPYGKCSNETQTQDRAQVNKGTVFTIPAVKGMVVTITATSAGSMTVSSFKFDGKDADEATSTGLVYTYEGDAETIDLIDQGSSIYPSSISVIYPAVEKEKSVATTITEAQYATFYADFAVTIPKDVTAYGTALNEEKTAITLTKIEGNVIPANTAVIIYSETEKEYTFEETSATAGSVSTVLEGGVTEITANDYVLGKGNNGVGFYHLSSTTIGANQAYLPESAVTANGARVAFIGFDNGTTAIKAVESAAAAGKAYNLNGVQAAPNAKGVVIMDGKKVVIK